MYKQKNYLDDFINYIDVGVIVVDKNSNIEFINKEALRILKISDKEGLNRNKHELLDFKIKDFLNSSNKNCAEKITFKNKEIVVFKSKIIDGNSLIGVFIFFQHLDKYKELTKQFNEEGKASFLLNTVMEATNDAIVYVNKEGCIEMFSNAYANFLEINKEDAIGKHVTEVIEKLV